MAPVDPFGRLCERPTFSFIRWDRLPGGELPEAPDSELVPNLAVEVLSKSNTPAEMKVERREYFAAGVQLVWLIDPESRTAVVYTAPEQWTEVDRDGVLLGDEVLPGFELPLVDLFARGTAGKRFNNATMNTDELGNQIRTCRPTRYLTSRSSTRTPAASRRGGHRGGRTSAPAACRAARDIPHAVRRPSAVVNEPRGSDVMVGALLCAAVRPPLHGRRDLLQQRRLLGHVRPWHDRRWWRRWPTWAGSGRRAPHRNARRRRHGLARDSGQVTIENVASYRTRPTSPSSRGLRPVHGDVAWGGNWFYLVHDHGLAVTLSILSGSPTAPGRFARPCRARASPVPMASEIDHIELFGPPDIPRPTARISSFVPAGPTIVRPAARAPAPSWPAWRPTASFSRGRSGVRRASSAAFSRARSKSAMAASTRESAARPT